MLVTNYNYAIRVWFFVFIYFVLKYIEIQPEECAKSIDP